MNFKIIIIISAVFIHVNSCGTYEDYKQQTHKEWRQSHKHSVGQTTLALIDEKRGRPLKTEIWFPTDDTSKTNVSIEYPFKLLL